MAIDYALARKEFPRLKAALTRAKNSGDPVKVLVAVEKAYDRFDVWGAWPDDWAIWRVAALDAYYALQRSDRFFQDDQEEIMALVERFGAVIQR